MDTTNYCIVAGISIVFLVSCLAHLNENDIFPTKFIHKLRRLIYLLMSEIIIDCIFALLEGRAADGLVLYIIKSAELIINPILAFLIFDLFYDKNKSRNDKSIARMRIIMISVIVVNGALLLAAIFGLNVFYIDEHSLYHRGPLMLIYVVLLFFIILALLYSMHLFSSDTQSTMRVTLLAFTAILILGVILRNVFSRYNYDFLCMSVSMPFLLIYYSHVIARIDPLTKLLNRQVYQRILKRIDYTTIVIMIDANDFKHINDTHGHPRGDKVLRLLARVIQKTYSEYAYCFRLGGDEFCAILKPNVFEELLAKTPDGDDRAMAEKLMKKLDDAILARTKNGGEGSYLKDGIAQGYGIFYDPSNHPSSKESLEEVIAIADKMMYDRKEEFKKTHDDSNQT